MTKVFNRAIKLGGQSRTINGVDVQALEYDGDSNILLCTGTTVPTADSSGFAKGCLFIKTDAADGTKGLYENQGTSTASDFNLVGAISSAEITLAQGSVLVGNASGVAAALDAKASGRILVGNGTTITSVAVTGDITLTSAGVASVNWGTSGTPLAHTANTDEAFSVHLTNSGTTGNYEPVSFNTTVTAAGMTGGRVKAALAVNDAMGAWSNALKADVTYGASGKTTGLGSAFVAEMTLSAGTVDGNYTLFEGELNVASDASLGTATALAYLSVNGTGAETVFSAGANSYILNIQGLTAGASNVFRTGLNAATVNAATTAALRIKVGAADYFIPLATATA